MDQEAILLRKALENIDPIEALADQFYRMADRYYTGGGEANTYYDLYTKLNGVLEEIRYTCWLRLNELELEAKAPF